MLPRGKAPPLRTSFLPLDRLGMTGQKYLGSHGLTPRIRMYAGWHNLFHSGNCQKAQGHSWHLYVNRFSHNTRSSANHTLVRLQPTTSTVEGKGSQTDGVTYSVLPQSETP